MEVFPAQAGMIPPVHGNHSDDDVFPAQAGMILCDRPRSDVETRVPRASGDDPLAASFTSTLVSCSPRKRG